METRETRPRKGGHTIQERETRREVGDNGRRQGETRPWEGGHAIQHKRILSGDNGRQAETRRDKGRQDLGKAETPSGRQSITGTHVKSDNGRQKGETRRPEGGGTIKHRHTCAETMGDNGRQLVQWETRVDKTSRRRGKVGDKGRQDLREGGHTIQHQGGHLKKALRTANSTLFGKQEGRQGETRGDKRGDKGRQGETRSSGRRTHHPTK